MKFLCDADRCIECNGCVTTCKNENELPWGVNRRRVVTIKDGEPGEPQLIHSIGDEALNLLGIGEAILEDEVTDFGHILPLGEGDDGNTEFLGLLGRSISGFAGKGTDDGDDSPFHSQFLEL